MAETIKQLRASRGYNKASITRLYTFVSNEADIEQSPLQILHEKKDRLLQLFSEYENYNKQLLAADDKEEDPDLIEIERKYFSILTKLNEHIKAKGSCDNKPSPSPPIQMSKTKLPTIQITPFNGKYCEYTPFINLFNAVIHNDRSLDNIQKLYYLRTFLQNEPFDIIKNLPLSNESYEQALSLLDKRYNNKYKIISEHINSLLDMQPLHRSTPVLIRDFVSKVKQCLASLKNLKVPVSSWDAVTLCILIRKLDQYTARAYQLERDTAEDPSVEDFLAFLEKRALALENSEQPYHAASGKQKVAMPVTATAEASPSCNYCKSDHKIFKCKSFKILSASKRIEFCKDNKLCNVCLNPHAGKCKYHFRCAVCKKSHNTLLHDDSYKGSDSSKETITLFSNSDDNKVLLPTVKVKLYSREGKEVHVKAILDSGSQASLVTTKVVDVLGLTPKQDSTNIIGVSNQNNAAKYCIPLEILSLTSPYKVSVNFHVLDKITCKLPQQNIDVSSLKIPPNVTLADMDFHIPSEINMLIGADIFFQTLLPEQSHLSLQSEQSAGTLQPQPQIINTRFGHIVAGALPKQLATDKVSLLCINCNTNINETLQNFWETEKVPETFTENVSEQVLAEEIFRETVKLESNTFQVDLPLKLPFEDISSVLGNSFDLALYRFLNLEKKLHKNINLLTAYQSFIDEYVQLGHGHYIDFNSIDFEKDTLYFLPHHAVINENSKSTKTRVVFDGSMLTDKKISLNDILLNGPTMQRDLFDIMLLFRLGDHTFSADIRRMFRNIKCNPEQCSLQNILWRSNPNEDVKCIRLDTVTYGLKPSSYLATRCLYELAENYKDEFPLASFILKNCVYIDDIWYSHSDINILIEAKRQLIELLEKGSFQTHKWASNNTDILSDIPPSKRQFDESDLNKNNYCMKALGLTLDVNKDCFLISCPEAYKSNSVTKREILSYISQFFDPLGFVSPVVVKAKVIMQQLWAEKVAWDDLPPAHIKQEWLSFATSLASMKPICLERNISIPDGAAEIQLIGFADASSSTGYGCCIYLRTLDTTDKAKLTLLCSKSRINPKNNKLTVPRLELNAMLLLSKLMLKVYNTLKIKININNVHLFSDSQIALAWLAIDPTKLNAYVGNRVKLIQEQTQQWSWSYVNTRDNPADLVSRGADPQEIAANQMWWHGPDFLQNSRYELKNKNDNYPEDLPELKRDSASSDKVTLLTSGDDFFKFLDKFSDLNKTIRVFAFILRFCHNIKPGNPKNESVGLSSTELSQALQTIIKHEQSIYYKDEITSLQSGQGLKGSLKPLHPFLDKTGIIRVGGRLQNSSIPYSQKHPIILPKDSRITKLIIHHEHLRHLHAGPKLLLSILNEKYWLVNGLRQIKKITHNCLICFRLKATTAKQLMGSLPQQRVTAARPFQVTGIDFAGPVQIKNSRIRRALVTKGYVCVFVCFTTKAIHLELANDLSTPTFLACFKRFIARRGLPTEVFCDNGGCFKGAANQLVELYKLNTSAGHQTMVQNYSAQQGINFHFVPSYSPVFAGLAEAAVKSMKYHLKRVLQKATLTYEQLGTVLAQIESILNSRPLLPLSSEVNDFSFLTPGHFLIGSALTAFPEQDTSGIPTNRLKFWQLCNQMRDSFWKVWHKHYLNCLQSRPKWRDVVPNVTVGALVIIRDPNMPPLFWPMARVVKVFPGSDGRVRVVEVMTPNKKIYKRSITGICILPLQ